jgi:hypothetical protein
VPSFHRPFSDYDYQIVGALARLTQEQVGLENRKTPLVTGRFLFI